MKDIILGIGITLWTVTAIMVATKDKPAWHTHQPRDGVECVAFHTDEGYDIDCYQVDKKNPGEPG